MHTPLEPSCLAVDQLHIPFGLPHNTSHKRIGKCSQIGKLASLHRKGMCGAPLALDGPRNHKRSPRRCGEQRRSRATSAQAWPEQTRLSLVSGFGPFRQHLVNSSWEAVKVQSLQAQTQEHGAQLVPSVVLENPAYGPLGDQIHMGGERTHTACPGTRSRLWSSGVTHLHPGARRAQQ